MISLTKRWGRPCSCSYARNAANGDGNTTPPRSKITARNCISGRLGLVACLAARPAQERVVMETKTDEVADGIYRFSTFIPEVGIPFNQYLVIADEPLLFHTGMRGLFPLVSEAVAGVMPLERLRWISFGHFEADECGAMNEWMAIAPDAQVAHSAIGVMVSVDDQATRPARPLQDGEVLDLGGKRVRHLYT